MFFNLISSGTSPTVSADVLTVTFAGAFTATPNVVFSPANVDAAGLGLGATSALVVTPAEAKFKFTTGSGGLAASIQQKWTYMVIR